MVERILGAGRQVLAEHGYEGASTSRIAATAEISPGSLYQYFPHKDAIVSAVLERYSDALVSSVTTRMSGHFEHPAPVIVRTTAPGNEPGSAQNRSGHQGSVAVRSWRPARAAAPGRSSVTSPAAASCGTVAPPR